MGNSLINISRNIITLAADTEDDGLINRIFGLDGQLGVDVIIVALAVMFLFFLLSYLVFNPARDLMKKRQEKIQGEMALAAKDKEEAAKYKAEYNQKLANAAAEADEILSEGRKKALKREGDIIDEANNEAKRIRERAEKEALLEKNKMQDEFKQEMISVAAIMAEKMISKDIDESKQAELIEEALNEMGDETWRS